MLTRLVDPTYLAVQDCRFAGRMDEAHALWQDSDHFATQHSDCPYPDCKCLGTGGNCEGWRPWIWGGDGPPPSNLPQNPLDMKEKGD